MRLWPSGPARSSSALLSAFRCLLRIGRQLGERGFRLGGEGETKGFWIFGLGRGAPLGGAPLQPGDHFITHCAHACFQSSAGLLSPDVFLDLSRLSMLAG